MLSSRASTVALSRQYASMEDLQRDLAVQLRVGGLPDLAHAAFPEEGGDVVVAEAGAGGQGHGDLETATLYGWVRQESEFPHNHCHEYLKDPGREVSRQSPRLLDFDEDRVRIEPQVGPGVLAGRVHARFGVLRASPAHADVDVAVDSPATSSPRCICRHPWSTPDP